MTTGSRAGAGRLGGPEPRAGAVICEAVEASTALRARESQLVYGLAGTQMKDVPEAQPMSERDWARVVRLAIRENAVVALYDYARRLPHGAVPEDVFRELACHLLDRRFRMSILERRLQESLILLHQEGIDVLLLKGAALSVAVHGSFVARPMSDVDLLVDAARAAKARDLLMGIGWTKDALLPGDDAYMSHHHLPPLRDADRADVRLEIHRSLLPAGHPFRFTENELWLEAIRIPYGGGVFILPPVLQAVHVCVHFAWSHMLQQGAWRAFCDLNALEQAGLLKWRELVAVARHWGAATCCYWTLRLARTLSGLPVPDDALRHLSPKLPEFGLTRLERHFTRGLLLTEAPCPSVRLNRALWQTAIQPQLQGHAKARPWLVSAELTVASEAARKEKRTRFWAQLAQTRNGARYVGDLLW